MARMVLERYGLPRWLRRLLGFLTALIHPSWEEKATVFSSRRLIIRVGEGTVTLTHLVHSENGTPMWFRETYKPVYMGGRSGKRVLAPIRSGLYPYGWEKKIVKKKN